MQDHIRSLIAKGEAKTITEAVQLYEQGQMERVTAEELLAEYGEG